MEQYEPSDSDEDTRQIYIDRGVVVTAKRSKNPVWVRFLCAVWVWLVSDSDRSFEEYLGPR